MEKDVMLGILPFYHIAGVFVGFLSLQQVAESTDCRGRNASSFCDYGRDTGRDYATI
jgi:hypothetical protein